MTESNRVWIVDDDKSIRWVLEKALSREGMTITSFAEPDAVLSRFTREMPDVILTDIRMPNMDGIQMMDEIRKMAPELPIIVMTAYSDLDRAVSAFQGGAFEYLSKPFDIDQVVG